MIQIRGQTDLENVSVGTNLSDTNDATITRDLQVQWILDEATQLLLYYEEPVLNLILLAIMPKHLSMTNLFLRE